tara:strand:- start:158 stop:1609 length:1452 start_codon:yes stop_codon:yes gene_type:complete
MKIPLAKLPLTKKYALVGLISLTVVLLYFLITRVVPLTTAIIGALIITVSLMPAFIHLWYEEDNKVPFFPMVGLFYCLFFGLPVFTLPIAWPDPTNILIYKKHPLGEISNEALLIVFSGVSIMIVAFFITRFIVQTRIPIFSLKGLASLRSARPLFWLLLAGYFFNGLHGDIMVLSSATQFLLPGSILSLGGLILCWVEGYLTRTEKITLILIILPLFFFTKIRYLFLTEVALAILFLIFIFWRLRMKKFILAGAACVGVLASVYGVAQVVRSEPQTDLNRMSQLTRSIVGYLDIRKDKIKVPERIAKSSIGIEDLAQRMSQLWIFQFVWNKTPEQQPYFLGQSYEPLLYVLIPRFLYPEKPEERFGNKFGQRYGIIKNYDKNMSLNLPWITELFINFGPLSVPLGMAFFGILLALLDRLFNEPHLKNLEFLIGLTIIYRLVYPESNFSVTTGTLPILFLSLVIYFCLGNKILSHLCNWYQRG